MKKKLLNILLVSQFIIGLPAYSNEADQLNTLEEKAFLYKKEKNLTEAIKTYEELIKLSPENISYYQELGDIYAYSYQDKYKALEVYDTGLKFVNPNITFSTIRSNKFLEMLYKEYNNDEKKVKESLEIAINQIKSTSNLYFSLATLYSELENTTEAEKYLLKGIEVNSRDWRFYNNLGTFYKDQRKPEKAIDVLNKGLDNINSFGHILLMNMGIIYEDMGLLDKAIQSYEASIKAEPKFTGPYFNLAIIYLKKNEDKEATDLLRDLLKYEPNNINAISVITATYLKNKEYDKTLSFIESYVDKRNLALYHKLLAVMYENKGETDKATANFNISCKNGDESSCKVLKK